MSHEVQSVIAGTLTLLGIIVLWRMDRTHPCHCRRSRLPWFAGAHESGRMMLANAAFSLAIIVSSTYFDSHRLVPIIWALVAAYRWRRWWLHEKDRIERAAKARGQIIIDRFGRLRVDPGGVPT